MPSIRTVVTTVVAVFPIAAFQAFISTALNGTAYHQDGISKLGRVFLTYVEHECHFIPLERYVESTAFLGPRHVHQHTVLPRGGETNTAELVIGWLALCTIP